MTARKAISVLLVLLLSVVAFACKRADPSAAADGGPARLRIAVIPKGTTHEFWKSVHAGAVKAAQELDVDIVWKGPLKEDDLKGQIDVVETFIAQGVSGIVARAAQRQGARRRRSRRRPAKIPVVIFDSDLAGRRPRELRRDRQPRRREDRRRDALAQARSAATGNVVVLRYQEGSASTANAREGLPRRDRSAHPDIKVVSDNQYGGATTESAFRSRARTCSPRKKAGPARRQRHLLPQRVDDLRHAARAAQGGPRRQGASSSASTRPRSSSGRARPGEIDGLVVQNPFKMGYLAVKTMVEPLPRREGREAHRHRRHARRPKTTSTTPEIKELLQPDLKTWLGE